MFNDVSNVLCSWFLSGWFSKQTTARGYAYRLYPGCGIEKHRPGAGLGGRSSFPSQLRKTSAQGGQNLTRGSASHPTPGCTHGRADGTSLLATGGSARPSAPLKSIGNTLEWIGIHWESTGNLLQSIEIHGTTLESIGIHWESDRIR